MRNHFNLAQGMNFMLEMRKLIRGRYRNLRNRKSITHSESQIEEYGKDDSNEEKCTNDEGSDA